MNSQLRKELIKYKDTTIELIGAVEKEDYDLLESLIEKRSKVIKAIEKLKYSQEEFRAICTELKILFFQDKMNKLMNEKKLKIKRQLDSMNENKNLRNSYNKKFNVDSIFFNKKI
ncbi:MAG TPA: flagellar protein FliT [Clostridium sp.]|jgi:hypothetical protein|nr:flagellar protein FliT [Clostridium sp.]